MDENPSPSLLDDMQEEFIDIPIPDITNPSEVLVSTKESHAVRIKRTAVSVGNPAKKRRLESELETLANQHLAKEVELNLVESKIRDVELSIRRLQTQLREAQNEKLSLVMVLDTINGKIKTTKSKLRSECKGLTSA